MIIIYIYIYIFLFCFGRRNLLPKWVDHQPLGATEFPWIPINEVLILKRLQVSPQLTIRLQCYTVRYKLWLLVTLNAWYLIIECVV